MTLRPLVSTLALAAAALTAACGGDAVGGGDTGTGGATADGGGGASASAGSSGQGGGGAGGTSGSGGGSASGGTSGSGGDGGGLTACTLPADCTIVPASCCGDCGAATRGDAVAIRRERYSEWMSENCAAVDCPACARPQDPTLFADCRGGTCEVVDLQAHPSTACTTDTDCHLRTTDCCECGGRLDREHVVAVSDRHEFGKLACGAPQACDECVPAPPTGVVARCLGGRCQAEWQ